MRDPIDVDVYHEQDLDRLRAETERSVSWARIVWVDKERSAPIDPGRLLDRWICRDSDGSAVAWLHNQPYGIQWEGSRVCVKVADIRRNVPSTAAPPFIHRRPSSFESEMTER